MTKHSLPLSLSLPRQRERKKHICLLAKGLRVLALLLDFRTVDIGADSDFTSGFCSPLLSSSFSFYFEG